MSCLSIFCVWSGLGQCHTARHTMEPSSAKFRQFGHVHLSVLGLMLRACAAIMYISRSWNTLLQACTFC